MRTIEIYSPKVIAILIFALLMFFYCCNSFAQGYKLDGKIKGVDDGWIFVRHRQTGKTDSCRIQAGHFSLSGSLTTPEFCTFGFSVNGIKDYYLSFFLEKGEFNMMASKDSLNDINIRFTGSQVENEFQNFQRQVSLINQRNYPQAKAETELAQLAATYALKHPGSYVSAFALVSYENNLAELSRLYDRLSPEIQRSYNGQLINNKVNHH